MRVLTLVLWFMGLVALTTGSALAETIWDVNADFSNANGNPNDAWSYGWLNNGVFQLYPTPNQLSQDGNPGWFGPLHTAPPGLMDSRRFGRTQVHPFLLFCLVNCLCIPALTVR